MKNDSTHTVNPVLPTDCLPPASLAICSLNRPHLLAETVVSILAGDELPAELIIIDQSDTPHATLSHLESVRGCRVRYFWSREKGISRARNRALQVAHHPIIVLTDDDMWATPAWFGALVRAQVAAGELAVITGQVPASEHGLESGIAPSTRTDDVEAHYSGQIERDVLFTNNMSLYRTAVYMVGYFDERLGPGTDFPAAEDNDFGYRLLLAGYCIHYIPAAVIYHRAWRSPRQFIRLHWNYGRGQGAFYAKHLSWSNRHTLRRWARDVGGLAIRLPFRLWRDRIQVQADALFMSGLVVGAGAWLLKQLRKPKT